jgi:hypothetical protein
MIHFDDFLGLAATDLTPYRTVIFHGRSGSGKSTAIEFLLGTRLAGRAGVVVVDEITTLSDLIRERGRLRSGGTLLVATHVSPTLVRLIAPSPAIVFHTDRDETKIARHIERRGISASAAVIETYVRRFGATYTDADLIMERWPAPSFDRSYATFLKLGAID